MPWRVLGGAALSALLLWISSPAVGVGWLAWVALVPVAAVVLAGAGSREVRLAVPLAFALYLELLLVPALPFGIAEGQWGDPVVPVMIGDSPVLFVALLAIPLVGAVLWAIGFGGAPGPAGPASLVAACAAVLVPAIDWTALDFLRVKLDPGGAFGPLFLSQADEAPGALASLAGPWLLTLAIVAVNYALALALVRRGWRHRRLASAGAGGCALLLVAAALAPADERGTVRVAAIQPGYDTAEEDPPPLRYFEPGSFDRAALDLIDDLGELTRSAVRAGAELVVWPEASIYVDPALDKPAAEALSRLARETGATLVVPYFDPEPDVGAALAVTPDGELGEPRPKQRSMWFLGEHRSDDAGPEPLAAGRLQVGTMLGIDNQDAGVAGGLADEGADLLVSATHDWPELATQQRALSRLAARATGLPLVRADWRYGSAIYGDDGEPLADAGTERKRTMVVADVAIGGSTTAYARLGDALGWLALAGAVLAWLVPPVWRLVTRR
jgi:apolipoprotein N-acyltransferase